MVSDSELKRGFPFSETIIQQQNVYMNKSRFWQQIKEFFSSSNCYGKALREKTRIFYQMWQKYPIPQYAKLHITFF
jgi:hypothetical protein